MNKNQIGLLIGKIIPSLMLSVTSILLFLGFFVNFDWLTPLFPLFWTDAGIVLYTNRFLVFASNVAYFCWFCAPVYFLLAHSNWKWPSVVLITAFTTDVIAILYCFFVGYNRFDYRMPPLLAAAIEALLVASQMVRLVCLRSKKRSNT